MSFDIDQLGPRPDPRLKLNKDEIEWVKNFQRMTGAQVIDGKIGGETLWLFRSHRLELLKAKFAEAPTKPKIWGALIAGFAIGMILTAIFLPACA